MSVARIGRHFGIGTILLTFFHLLGNLHFAIDRLKRLVTAGVILIAVCLIILAEIPSGPLAFIMPNKMRNFFFNREYPLDWLTIHDLHYL